MGYAHTVIINNIYFLKYQSYGILDILFDCVLFICFMVFI